MIINDSTGNEPSIAEIVLSDGVGRVIGGIYRRWSSV